VEVFEQQGRFAECRALCLEKLDWIRAQDDGAGGWECASGRDVGCGDFERLAGNTSHSALLLGCLRSFGLIPSASSPQRIGSTLRECWNRLQQEREVLAGDERLLMEALGGLAENVNAPDSAWLRSFWESWDLPVHTSRAGHALRFQVAAVAVAARQLCFNIRELNVVQWLDCLNDKILQILAALERSLSHRARGAEEPWLEQFVMELLLAEQPPSLSPGFLVLSEFVSDESERSMGRCDLFLLAQRILHLLRIWLCGLQLQYRKKRSRAATPCWSQLMHGHCSIVGCAQAHSWGRTEGDAFAAALRSATAYLETARRLVESSEVEAACRALRREEARSKVLLCLRSCEEELCRSCLPDWHSMGWLSPGSRAGVAAEAARAPLIQRRIDELLGDVRAALRRKALAKPKQWLGIEDVLKAPLVLCPLVDFHGLPSLRQQVRKDTAWALASKMLSIMETLQAENPARAQGEAKRPTYDDLLNFFEMTCEVVQHLEKSWTRPESDNSYPYCPEVVCHLLEQGVVWANVLLTRMSNTTLPESYVRMHLSRYPHLAGLAAQNELPQGRKQKVIDALWTFARAAAIFLEHSGRFENWVKATDPDAQHGTSHCLRLFIIIFSSATINWLRHQRNTNVCEKILRGIGFQHRLRLMNGGSLDLGAGSFPKKLQWLVAGPPRDESATNGRQFDRMTPWVHAVLSDFNNPLVILHRGACSDAPPGWTYGQRHLEFHREDFVKKENLPKLYACLNVSREGPIWEETVESWRPGFVTVSHPPVRRVIVYTPGQEACDFSGLFVANSPLESESSPPEDSHEGGFVLNTDASNEANQEHHFEGDLEAAAALVVEAQTLPLRMVLVLLIALRRIRVRLAATSGPRDVLVRSSLAWLAREQASLQERRIYLRFVVPVLAKSQEETRLNALRQEVGHRAGSPEDKAAIMQVQELLDEMQVMATQFRQKHEQQRVQDGLEEDMRAK
ncbi:unnamed protein product, partial [Symbiodinium sp. KB8]